jgi:hypothetical protein
VCCYLVSRWGFVASAYNHQPLEPSTIIPNNCRLFFCMYHAPRTRLRKASLPCTYQQASLRLRTITSTYTPARKPKEEGSIASVFTSLSGSAPPLPTRFSDLKKEIWRDVLVQSWREVLDELKGSIEKVVARGANVLQLTIRYGSH